MAWLPATSTTVEPARADISRWAAGAIIRSSVATRYQLGLLRHAGSLIVPPSASTPEYLRLPPQRSVRGFRVTRHGDGRHHRHHLQQPVDVGGERPERKIVERRTRDRGHRPPRTSYAATPAVSRRPGSVSQ